MTETEQEQGGGVATSAIVTTSSSAATTIAVEEENVKKEEAREETQEMNPPPAKRERLGDCEVCNQGVQGKYRCPRCSIVFCSAVCCKKHKADTGCNGIRDKCGFVPLDQFNDRTMLSDYVLLEDAQRKKDNGYRTLNGISNSRHSQKAINLVKQAEFRGTTLVLMPEGMSRRKTNTTYFSQRGKTIHWKVEFFFEKGVSVSIKKVNENMTPEKIIQKFLSDPYNKHTYSKFPALTIEPKDMTFLMIDCDSPNHNQKFFELGSTVPLKELFNGKRILEHPQIYVVKPEDKSKFSIIPSPPPIPLQQKQQGESKNVHKDKLVGETEEKSATEEVKEPTTETTEEGEEGEEEERVNDDIHQEEEGIEEDGDEDEENEGIEEQIEHEEEIDHEENEGIEEEEEREVFSDDDDEQ